MEIAIVIAVVCYIGFRFAMQISKRNMVHRERMAAIEKGIELPPMDAEVKRNGLTVQRILLLAGLVWLSLGIGAFVTLSALLAHQTEVTAGLPSGMQWIGLAPALIGLSHLIVFLVGRSKEKTIE